MVVKIQSSYKGTKTTIDYNEEKVDLGLADRIGSFNFDGSHADDVYDIFSLYERRNIRSENVSFQMTINPNHQAGETLTDQQALTLANELMTSLGYGKQPIVVYRHNDIDREHYHVVSIRTDENGKKIKDFKERKDLQRELKKLEPIYGFKIGSEENARKEETIHPSPAPQPIPVPPRRLFFNPNEGNVSRRYLEAWEAAMKYRFTSFTQFKAVMEWYGLNVQKITSEGKDILFLQGIGPDMKGVVTPMTETELGRQMLTQIESRAEECKKDPKRHLKERRDLANMAETAMSRSSTLEELKKNLEESGVGILISRNKDGNIFGVTLVDHQTRQAYKATEVSRLISAKTLREMESGLNPEANQESAEKHIKMISAGLSDAGSDAMEQHRYDSLETGGPDSMEKFEEFIDDIADLMTTTTKSSDAEMGRRRKKDDNKRKKTKY